MTTIQPDDPAVVVAVQHLQAGDEVWLPDVRSWHRIRAIETNRFGERLAWLGMSSHATRLTEPTYRRRAE